MATLILAGCGGSGHPNSTFQTVKGPGFTFQAPAGWTVTRAVRQVTAAEDSELVRVATFPLMHAYTDALFARVAAELAARMKDVAAETGGTVSGSRTVTADGIRSHAFDVTVGDHVDEYTFVLSGKREFQLLCRRRSSGSSEACRLLVSSFARA